MKKEAQSRGQQSQSQEDTTRDLDTDMTMEEDRNAMREQGSIGEERQGVEETQTDRRV